MFNKVISIEIGILKTRICELDYQKKTPHLYRCISFDTPEGSYGDGYIKDKDALADIIKDRMKEAGFKSKRLVFSLTSTKIANREVIIPLVNQERIQDVVMANVEEYFPIDISEYAITYNVLEKLNIENEKKLRLLVLAAPNQMVKDYYELAELLGLEVASIDYMGNSMYQLVKNHVKAEINMVLHIDEYMTCLNILENGVLTLSRVVNYGTMNLIDTILNSKHSTISKEDEALAYLHSEVFAGNNIIHEAAASIEIHEVKKANLNSLLLLRDEIYESFQYLIENIARILDYISRNMDKRIGTIYLVGQSTAWYGLEEYLQQRLAIDVIAYKDNSMTIRKSKHISQDLSEYMICVGAAIQPVKFIPREHLEKYIGKSNLLAIIFAFVAGVIISIAIILIPFFGYKNELVKSNILKTEISNLSQINQIYEEHHLVSEKLNQVETMYALTNSYNEQFSDLLKEIEKNLPTAALVDSLNVSTDGLSLSFVADSVVTVAKTLQQLRTIPALTNIFTTSLQISEDEHGLHQVKFVLEADYNMEAIQSYQNNSLRMQQED